MAPRRNPPKRRSKVADRQTQAKPRKQNAAKTLSRTAPAVSKQPTRRSRRGQGLSAENNGLPEPARKKSGGSEKKSGTAGRKRKPPGEAPDQPAQKRQKSRQAPKDIEESIRTGDLSGRDHVPPRSEDDIEEYPDPIENWRHLGDWPTSFRHSEAMSRSGDHSGDLNKLRECQRQRRDSRSSTVNTQRSGQQVPQDVALEDATEASEVTSTQETQKRTKPRVYTNVQFRKTLGDGCGNVRCFFQDYTVRQPDGKKDTGPSPASTEWRTRLQKEDNKEPPEDYRFKGCQAP